MASLNDKYKAGNAFYFTDANGQHVTTDLAGRASVSEGMVEETPVRFADADGNEWRVPSWGVEEFAKNNLTEGRSAKPMERWTLEGNSRGGADDIWVSAFDDLRKEDLTKRGWKSADAANPGIVDTIFNGMSADDWRAPENRDGENGSGVAGDVKYHAENVARGVGGAFVAGATGVAKTIGDLLTSGGAFVADAFGADNVAENLRATKREIDERAGKVLDWTVDNVLGEAFFNEGDGTREMVKGGLKAAEEVGGLFGLGKVVGLAGQGVQAVGSAAGKTVDATKAATGAMVGLMGAQGYEDTISAKEAAGKEVTWRDQVAAGINGGVAAAVAPLYGKVAGLIGKEEAGRVIKKSYGKMLKAAALDVAEGTGLSAAQAAAGEAADAVQGGEADMETRAKRVMTSAAVGGALVAGTKVPGALGGWVRQNRINYARAATMQGESALAATRAGMPLERSRWSTDDVRGVSQNGEVIFTDGTVYVPARMSAEGVRTSDPKIVIADGTVLSPAGKVIGVRATKLGYLNEVRGMAATPAESVYRQVDPDAPYKFRIVDPETGASIENGALAGLEAPESIKGWVAAKQAGESAPQLDADGVAYTALWQQAHSVNPEISRAAQIALEQVATGKMGYRQAAEVVDNAISQTRGWQNSIYGQLKRGGAIKPEAAAGTDAEMAAEPIRTDLPAIGNIEPPARDGGAMPKETTEAAKTLLGYVADGTIAPTEIPAGAVVTAADAPTVTGAASAGPIIVRQNADGTYTAILGGDKIDEAKSAGAKAVKAVVVTEDDGWTENATRAIAAVEALKSGEAGAADTVRAIADLGLTSEDLGGIVKTDNGEAAARYAEIANRLSPMALDALTDENVATLEAIGDEVNANTVGFGWLEIQSNLVTAMPAGTDADVARMAGTIGAMDPAKDASQVWTIAGWAAANADKPGVVDALTQGEHGVKSLEEMMAKDDAGTVPVEMANGDFKTVDQVEAEAPKTAAVDLPRPTVDQALKLSPIEGEDGVFHCARFPEVTISFDAGEISVTGLTVGNMLDGRNRYEMGALLKQLADIAGERAMRVNLESDELVDLAGELVANYADEKRERAMQARAKAVGKVLMKSGLGVDIVTDPQSFEEELMQYPDGVRLAKDGKTWGFYSPRNGKVYLNEALQGTKIFLNTTIHEFAHPAVIATREVNPELYNRGMELIEQTDYYKLVKGHSDYAQQSERSIREEALVRLLSDRLEDIKAKVPAKIYKEIEDFVKTFWAKWGEVNGIADLTPAMVQTMTIEDIADAIGAEMESGRPFGKKVVAQPEQMELGLNRPAISANDIMLSRGGFTPKMASKERTAVKLMPKLYGEAEATRVKANLEKHRGTPWHRQAVESILIRQDMQDLLAGRKPTHASKLLAPSTAPAAAAIRKGPEGIFRYLQNAGIIGHASKPVNAVNSSFVDCDPSEDCAKYCYAAKGNYAFPIPAVKSEMVTWAVKHDPIRTAKMIVNEYKCMPEFELGKALRLFDKGDISAAWLPVIREGNRHGVFFQIFARRPELLRKVDSRNVRALSIDRSNYELAEKNKDLPIAVVFDGSEECAKFLDSQRSRYEKLGGVVLPITKGDAILSAEELARIPAWAKPFVCPVNSGKAVISKKSGDGGWTCTRCDSKGGLGCFYHRTTMLQQKIAEAKLDDSPLAKRKDIQEEFSKLETLLKEVKDETLRNKLFENLAHIRAEISEGVDAESDEALAEESGSVREEESGAGERSDESLKLARGGSAADRSVLVAGRARVAPAEDAAYMDAVKRGDMEAAQRMVREAAAKEGYEIAGFHGTSAEFNRFKTRCKLSVTGSLPIFLSKDFGTASSYGKRVISALVKMNNPAVVDCGSADALSIKNNWILSQEDVDAINSKWDNPKKKSIYDSFSTDQIAYAMRLRGNDGVVFNNVKDSYLGNRATTVYVVFNGRNVKSADPVTYDDAGNVIPLSERFNKEKNDIRFARGGSAADRSVFVAGRARVANDAGMGERTPGIAEASRELSNQPPVPISMYGQIHRLALPVSEIEWLRKRLTGDASPAIVGNRRGVSAATGKVAIEADVFGTVDKTDMAAEKARLVAHGFYRNEDPIWCSMATSAQIAAERARSEDQLATQLLKLGARRNAGREDGGQGAARGAFAAEVAKLVMDMPGVMPTSVLGRVQTIGQGIRSAITAGIQAAGGTASDAEQKMRDEGGAFLDWAYGDGGVLDASGARVPRAQALPLRDITSEMFGKWLIMPQAVENQAPTWSAAMLDAVVTTPKLADAWRELTVRGMSYQAHSAVADAIAKSQTLEHEKALAKLRAEGNEPIKAGGAVAQLKEQVIVGIHDTLGPVYLRINEQQKAYIAAKKKLMKTLTPAQRAVVQADIDAFIGTVANDVNKMELARTAWERGSWNEGRRYIIQMDLALNEATERDGQTIEDISKYENLRRIVESQGRAGSFGISARQASLELGDMARRLGAEKWTKLQATDRKIHAIIESEVLNDPRFVEMFGAGFADYCRSQVHYVTTRRVFSPEELDAIEQQRAMLRATGVNTGDDVIAQMYAYAGKLGAEGEVGETNWTARLKGSMSASQEALSATFAKQMAMMNVVRRNDFVIKMRDALLSSGVVGVKDMRRRDGAKWPENRRYGKINYMQDGEKRVLVVPRQIADGMKHDAGAGGLIAAVNSFCRSLYIDYNVAYWNQNINRNNGSIEKNMPGMSEPWMQTLMRPLLPGVNKQVMLGLEHIIRHMPERTSLPLRMMLGKHTPYFFIPQAKRYADFLQDPTAWQKRLWAAEDAGDTETVTRMLDDLSGVMGMLRGNMFVPSHHAYTAGQTNGFLNDVFDQKGLKLAKTVAEETAAKSKMCKILEAVNVFKRNQAQQEWEDVFAKTKAYLHDRMQFAAHRTEAESGQAVKKNVSIAEGERHGSEKAWIQKFFAQFFNMCEKGNARHFKAYAERPGETIGKSARVWIGRFVGALFANGVIMKIMLNDDEVKGDENKARKKFGDAYDYAKFLQRSSRNVSAYTKANAEYLPIWTSPDGYTSILLASPLNDEDKIITPTADAAAQTAAYAMGIGAAPDWGDAVVNSTIKAVTPDLQATTPVMNLGKTIIASMTDWNPTDQFRQAPMFPEDKHATKFRSLEDLGDFGVLAGMRLWNDFGGRAILQAPVNGVDNGRGSAPASLEVALSKIPVMSPAIARYVKIQVGSPEKRGAAILEERKDAMRAVRICAKRLLEMTDGDTGIHQADPKAYEAKIAEWTAAYGLNKFEVANLRKLYLNGWNQKAHRKSFDQKALNKLRIEARKQGLDDNDIWIQLGDQ